MASSPRPKPSRDKVRAHRKRLRRQGLRPIQIWVPDVRSPTFKAEAHRQSLVDLLRLTSERVLAPGAAAEGSDPGGEGATGGTAVEGPQSPSS